MPRVGLAKTAAQTAASAFALSAVFTCSCLAAPASAATIDPVYSFRSGIDGAGPDELVSGPNGTFFGTTYNGGTTPCSNNSYGCGTVFELVPSRGHFVEKILHRFTGGSDGFGAVGSIVLGRGGAIFGTTAEGGSSGDGIAYELSPSGNTYTETIIHTFSGNDGSFPNGLVAGDSGALLGTATLGGPLGNGIAFKLTPSGSKYTESDIYDFGAAPSDGFYPGALTVTPAGTFLGSTAYGPSTYGTVFSLKRSGQHYVETTLLSFNETDGAGPNAQFIFDNSGNAYSTAPYGGNCFGIGCSGPDGLVFKLTSTQNGASETVLHAFGKVDGRSPESSLVLGAGGVLYGVTTTGANKQYYMNGTAFKLTPAGNGYTETILAPFEPKDGSTPYGNLVVGRDGAIYGTTRDGGADGFGTVFKLKP